VADWRSCAADGHSHGRSIDGPNHEPAAPTHREGRHDPHRNDVASVGAAELVVIPTTAGLVFLLYATLFFVSLAGIPGSISPWRGAGPGRYSLPPESLPLGLRTACIRL